MRQLTVVPATERRATPGRTNRDCATGWMQGIPRRQHGSRRRCDGADSHDGRGPWLRAACVPLARFHGERAGHSYSARCSGLRRARIRDAGSGVLRSTSCARTRFVQGCCFLALRARQLATPAAADECKRDGCRGQHQEQADRVEYRGRPLAHASIHHDRKRRVRTDQHERRVEVLE